MRRTVAVFSALALTAPLAAQSVRVYADGADRVTVARAAPGDRAMIGISTSSGSRRDTLGVLVSAITEGGPAEKAGLMEGDRIQSINGVSLRVGRDDAGDDEMGGIMQRRLTRELGKVKAGDEVTLQVWREGAARTFKVKTAAAEDLMRPARVSARNEDRAVIGIGFGLTGSKRDTAGVFVNSVTEDGPAEKAGIVEGDRIAAINGVSLRLTRDDLDEPWMANTRLNRLSREVAKGKPGDVVELTVLSGGRSRSVKVTLAKASSLKSAQAGGFTYFRSPDAPMAPVPPMSGMTIQVPRPPMAPRAPMVHYRSFDGNEAELQLHLEELRPEIERALRSELPKMKVEMQRSMEQVRKELQAARVRGYSGTVRM